MKIALIGSAKFESDFSLWETRLSLCGFIVYSICCTKSDIESFTDRERTRLDMVRYRKVQESQVVGLLNKNNYIGASTQRALDWAKMLGKPLYATDPGYGLGASLMKDLQYIAPFPDSFHWPDRKKGTPE